MSADKRVALALHEWSKEKLLDEGFPRHIQGEGTIQHSYHQWLKHEVAERDGNVVVVFARQSGEHFVEVVHRHTS